jgi:hypothetical protein
MSYATSGLQLLVRAPGGSGKAIWLYTGTDAHTDVDATDYFSDGKDRGMKAGDLVFVVNTGTSGTMHYVSAIDSDGNATISAATLA